MKKNQDTVEVRELRRNLDVYLRRVASGARLRVTNRGRTMAALIPFRGDDSRLILAKGDLLELGPPQGQASTRASEALAELREERF